MHLLARRSTNCRRPFNGPSPGAGTNARVLDKTRCLPGVRHELSGNSIRACSRTTASTAGAAPASDGPEARARAARRLRRHGAGAGDESRPRAEHAARWSRSRTASWATYRAPGCKRHAAEPGVARGDASSNEPITDVGRVDRERYARVDGQLAAERPRRRDRPRRGERNRRGGCNSWRKSGSAI